MYYANMGMRCLINHNEVLESTVLIPHITRSSTVELN
jgi:hypothetical protein